MYKFKNNDLVLTSVPLSYEIRKGNPLLTGKDITIFNSSVINIKNSSNLLIASRGWYGNVRSWDGINFTVLTIFDKNYKKIHQNVLDIDKSILEEHSLRFKEYKNRIVVHQKQITEGPEDPRLFYFKGEIYILVNEIDDADKDPRKRLMYLSPIDLNTLDYKTSKTLVCESLSTNFEKNWGPFIYNDKLHMLYDINPLKIMEVNPNFKCKMVVNKTDSLMSKLDKSFGDLHFHMRNSTNLIKMGSDYLGLGHAVLDYKDNSEINKFLIPSIDSSNYNSYDKDYFKRFYKLYLGFFFCLDMKKKEITSISPFFQLPSRESKQELIFFPTSIYEDKEKFINISYSLGDNRSYLCKLHSEVIKSSLYDKENINIHMNFGINMNYYLELLRTLRIVFNYSHKLKDYVKYPKKDYTKREKRSLMKNSRPLSKINSKSSVKGTKGSLKRKNKKNKKRKNKSRRKSKKK